MKKDLHSDWKNFHYQVVRYGKEIEVAQSIIKNGFYPLSHPLNSTPSKANFDSPYSDLFTCTMSPTLDNKPTIKRHRIHCDFIKMRDEKILLKRRGWFGEGEYSRYNKIADKFESQYPNKTRENAQSFFLHELENNPELYQIEEHTPQFKCLADLTELLIYGGISFIIDPAVEEQPHVKCGSWSGEILFPHIPSKYIRGVIMKKEEGLERDLSQLLREHDLPKYWSTGELIE